MHVCMSFVLLYIYIYIYNFVIGEFIIYVIGGFVFLKFCFLDMDGFFG